MRGEDAEEQGRVGGAQGEEVRFYGGDEGGVGLVRGCEEGGEGGVQGGGGLEEEGEDVRLGLGWEGWEGGGGGEGGLGEEHCCGYWLLVVGDWFGLEWR